VHQRAHPQTLARAHAPPDPRADPRPYPGAVATADRIADGNADVESDGCADACSDGDAISARPEREPFFLAHTTTFASSNRCAIRHTHAKAFVDAHASANPNPRRCALASPFTASYQRALPRAIASAHTRAYVYPNASS